MALKKSHYRTKSSSLVSGLMLFWAFLLYFFGFSSFDFMVSTLVTIGIYYSLANKGMREHVFIRRYLRQNFLKYTIPALIKLEKFIDKKALELIEKAKQSPKMNSIGLKLEKLIMKLRALHNKSA